MRRNVGCGRACVNNGSARARRGESAWHAKSALLPSGKRILRKKNGGGAEHSTPSQTPLHRISRLKFEPDLFQFSSLTARRQRSEPKPFGRGLNHPHSRDFRSPGRSVHGPRPPRARSLNAPANARAVERLLHCRRQRTPIDALRHCVGWPSDTLRRVPARSAADMRDTRPTRYIFILHGHPLSCNNPFPLRAQPLPPSPPHPPSDRCSFPPSPSR